MENSDEIAVDLTASNGFIIIVNARKHKWEKKEISFEEVVIMAFGSISSDPNIVYTVIYKRGPDENPDGSMVRGDKIFVKSEMVFNATSTDKS
jgi:hypothetical protein